jgi:uncharacterized membrane protein (UPF0127 family)
MSKPTFLGPLIGKSAGRYELVRTERGSVLATHVEPAFDSKTRRRGLLGRDSVPEDYALIIAPCGSVHTFFMRFPLDLLFVSRNGTVLKTCRSVKPWRMAGALRAFAVIEAAPGFIDRTDIVPGEVVGLREIPERRRASDALPPIAGTPSEQAVIPRARPGGASTPVTLADIIAHQTPLAWFESVAIVQELCATLLALGPAEDPRVPELPHITLHPVGGVTLLAQGPAGESSVRRTCLVLLALTPEERLPTELRLVVLGGLLPMPRFASLEELHTELQFYERPNRLEIVRVVYERFQAGPAPDGAATANEAPHLLDSPPPLELPLRLPAPASARLLYRRQVRGAGWQALLIVGATIVVVWVLWEWQRPEGQWLRVGVATIARAVWTAGAKASQAVVHALGVGK